MSQNDHESKLSRRDFARRAAIAAASAAALPAGMLGAARADSAAADAAQTKDGSAAAEDHAEIESKIQAIFRRYGDRLSAAQKADIRRLVTEGQKPLQAMRSFPLGNADQPGNVLKLYPDPPDEDATPAEPRR